MTWGNHRSTRYRFQYRYAYDTGWQLISMGDSLEGAQEYIDREYLAYPSRNYVVRLYDSELDHVIYQLQPRQLGEWTAARLEEFPEIAWSETKTNSGDFKKMIKTGVRRIDGKLMLYVNAADFHKELDSIGVRHDGMMYSEGPATSNAVASSSHQMSTNMLLKRDYKELTVIDVVNGEKVEKKIPVTATANLSTVFTTPPSLDQLKRLCNSANDAARKILTHYQPIDISVEIHKRVLKGA